MRTIGKDLSSSSFILHGILCVKWYVYALIVSLVLTKKVLYILVSSVDFLIIVCEFIAIVRSCHIVPS